MAPHLQEERVSLQCANILSTLEFTRRLRARVDGGFRNAPTAEFVAEPIAASQFTAAMIRLILKPGSLSRSRLTVPRSRCSSASGLAGPTGCSPLRRGGRTQPAVEGARARRKWLAWSTSCTRSWTQGKVGAGIDLDLDGSAAQVGVAPACQALGRPARGHQQPRPTSARAPWRSRARADSSTRRPAMRRPCAGGGRGDAGYLCSERCIEFLVLDGADRRDGLRLPGYLRPKWTVQCSRFTLPGTSHQAALERSSK